MVHGIHAHRAEAAVLADGVPALPDGGRALLHLVEPAGAFRLQEQRVGVLIQAVLGQRGAQVGRADEAGGQPDVVDPQTLGQVLRGHGPLFGLQQAEVQRHGLGGLGLGDHPPVFGHVLPSEGLGHPALQVGVIFGVLSLAQQPGGLGHDAGGQGVVGRGDQVRGGQAEQVVRVLGVLGQPVAQGELIVAVHAFVVTAVHEVHPGLHGGILRLQHRRIAIVPVQRPGDDGGRVAPAGDGDLPDAGGPQDVGHHHGHVAVHRLLQGQVAQVLAEEGVGVHVQTGGAAEDLGVARPAHALVPLGAVGGAVHEVGLLPPQAVAEQLIYPGVGALEAAGGAHVGVDRHALKGVGIDLPGPAGDLHVAEAEVTELGQVGPPPPVADVAYLRQGRAHVVPVEVAVPVQRLAELEPQLGPRRGVGLEAQKPRQVLAEVQHRLPLGRHQHCGPEALVRLHRDAHAGLQQAHVHVHSPGMVPPADVGLRQAPAVVLLPGVVDLAVVDLRPQPGAFGRPPALVRAEDPGCAVYIGHPQLADKGQRIPVDVIAVAEALPDVGPVDAALVVAVAQAAAQGVFAGAELPGDVVGLVLEPLVVGVEAGGKDLLAHPLSVQRQGIKPHAAGVHPGGTHGLFKGKVPPQLREFPRPPDPAPRPGLVVLARLKPRGLGPVGGRARLIPDHDPPEIPGPGRQGQLQPYARAHIRRHPARVIHRRIKIPVGHLDAVGRLRPVHSVRNGHPAQAGPHKIIPHRVGHIVAAEIRDPHIHSPLVCICGRSWSFVGYDKWNYGEELRMENGKWRMAVQILTDLFE